MRTHSPDRVLECQGHVPRVMQHTPRVHHIKGPQGTHVGTIQNRRLAKSHPGRILQAMHSMPRGRTNDAADCHLPPTVVATSRTAVRETKRKRGCQSLACHVSGHCQAVPSKKPSAEDTCRFFL